MMKRITLLVFSLAAFVSLSQARSIQPPCRMYLPNDSSGFSVVTSEPDLPILLFLERDFGIGNSVECDPLPEGVLAEVHYPDGQVLVIPQVEASGSASVSLMQDEETYAVANACGEVDGLGYPYVIAGSDLPFRLEFDATLATDSGDFRGTAADGISRPGGKDGFWEFVPDKTGTYLFTMGAIKESSSPIPGHDFELVRGFGGVGVWSGECGSLVEIETACSIVGDSAVTASLDAGERYYVVWEDYYVGSTESAVILSIKWIGEPKGNDIMNAINLSDLPWDFEKSGDSTPNQDLAVSECLESEEGGGHGAGSGSISGPEVWYRLPSVESGQEYVVDVDSGEGDFPVVDSVLSLHAYNLDLHQVSLIDCSDDGVDGNRHGSIRFIAESGLIYYVMVETKISYDQPPFGQFVLKGRKAIQSSFVNEWKSY